MGSNRNHIPGLRCPTTEERAWIAEHWGSELELRHVSTSGKILLYVALVFLCFGIVGLLFRATGLIEAVALLIVAAACVGFYYLNRHSDSFYRNRIIALKNGNYQVTSAVCVKVRSGEDCGVIKAELPSGQPLKGVFFIPDAFVQPLLRQKNHRFPILLICFANDTEILAIPVRQ